MIRMSISPSLSKSPKAQPRLTWRALRAGWLSSGICAKGSVAEIAEEDARTLARVFWIYGVELGIDLAGDEKNVGVSVVVEIDQSPRPN